MGSFIVCIFYECIQIKVDEVDRLWRSEKIGPVNFIFSSSWEEGTFEI
jgi:hypothetical protein